MDAISYEHFAFTLTGFFSRNLNLSSVSTLFYYKRRIGYSQIMEAQLEQLAIELFKINAVKFGEFTLKTGLKSPIYFDLRVIISYPDLMKTLAEVITEKITNLKNHPKHVCGVPYTALPLATLVAVNLNKGLIMRRKEAKDYGTKKMIEGIFEIGDSVIIIEDVITSGSSIIETANELEKVGLTAKQAVVLLDREQGAQKNLLNRGIETTVLLTLSRLLEILSRNGFINDETRKSVLDWTLSTKITLPDCRLVKRLAMSLTERKEVCKNALTRKMFELIERKKSLLVVSADITESALLLKLARAVGPYAVIFKTHADLVDNFSDETAKDLRKIADEYEFLIMEDRKFSDIGNTVALQYKKIQNWADLVTVHSLPGPGILEAFKTSQKIPGCFLVAELSCKNALTDSNYAKATMNIVENYMDLVAGVVCQNADLVQQPNLLQMTPGVKFQGTGDILGQQYVSPEEAILKKGADLIVVGRGIISDENPAKVAQKYQEASWKAFSQRIQK